RIGSVDALSWYTDIARLTVAPTHGAPMCAPGRTSEGQRKFGSVRRKHAAEFGLNAFESCFVVGFKAEHNDRCRIRGTRKAEAVGIFHAQAVDTDYLGSARKFGRCREPRDQRMRRL